MPRTLVYLVSHPSGRDLAAALACLDRRRLPDDVELLVIDDSPGAPGASREVSPPDATPPPTVLRTGDEQGPGGLQKLALRYAVDRGFDLAVSLNGDGGFSAELPHRLLEPLLRGEADAVLGARRLFPASTRGGLGFSRLLGRRLLTGLQNLVLRTRFGDLHSGFRAYSIAAVSAVPFERNTNGDTFDSEIVLQLLAAGRRIAEVAVPAAAAGVAAGRGAGIWSRWRDIAATLTACLQSWGLLYRRKFDVQGEAGRYALKLGYPSSHSCGVDAVPEGSRVLDVGCGAGELGALLQSEKGCRVIGIEGEPARAARAAARLSGLIRHDLDDVACLDHDLGEVDVVLLLDVVEHLRRPEEFLDQLRLRLGRHRPRVVLTVPNVAFFVVRWSLFLGWFNYGPRGILDRTHTRLFTFTSLRRLLEEAGFEPPRLHGIPAPFPLALGPTRAARWLLALNGLLIRLLPTLFSFQIFAETRLRPLVSHLLEDSVGAVAAGERAAVRR